MKYVLLYLYLAAVILANVVTAAFAPLHFGEFIVPAGTFFIGATFILRNLVQRIIGRRDTYLLITIALALSAVTSFTLGDTLWIVAASALSFALSEATETEVFTRLRITLPLRMFYSGIIGGALDSVVFVIIGLSPIGAGFLPWVAVPMAIIGQFIVKSTLQAVGAVAVKAVAHE